MNKLIEISLVNSAWNFHTPKINSHITYISTINGFNEDLKNISDNYDFIYIDSTHEDIINKDVGKINKYLK